MNFTIGIALLYFGNFFSTIVMVRAVMSWIPFNRNGFFGKFYMLLCTMTEPVAGPIRRIIHRSPLGGSAIDFSPMLAAIAMFYLTRLLANFFFSL